MPQIIYTTTGAQDEIIIDPEKSTTYSVTADAGTPVFTVQVKLHNAAEWVSPSSTSGTTLGEAFALQKPVSGFRLNISNLDTATEVYLDISSVK